ncbi:MAG: helix-turn-helix domain-containing protein [Muribaculaceae bacterium]|nr:helix-turn-helix domain-containing protein [Muribaculaceae bacterium]
MTQEKRVLEHLQKHGSITTLEMFNKFCICCPHSIIRNIRNKFGYDYIADLWITKKRKEQTEQGKERTVSTRYKQYFLKKFERIENV